MSLTTTKEHVVDFLLHVKNSESVKTRDRFIDAKNRRQQVFENSTARESSQFEKVLSEEQKINSNIEQMLRRANSASERERNRNRERLRERERDRDRDRERGRNDVDVNADANADANKDEDADDANDLDDQISRQFIFIQKIDMKER